MVLTNKQKDDLYVCWDTAVTMLTWRVLQGSPELTAVFVMCHLVCVLLSLVNQKPGHSGVSDDEQLRRRV